VTAPLALLAVAYGLALAVVTVALVVA